MKIIYLTLILSLFSLAEVKAEENSDSISLARENREIAIYINDWIDTYKLGIENKDISVIKESLNHWGGNHLESKEGFLKKLEIMMDKEIFQSDIDSVSILKHMAKPRIYGLNFHQEISTANFSESGWFFLLFDFNDPEKVQIHICTYQTDEEVEKNGVFTLDDFFIP